MEIQLYIANLGKYNEGILQGSWFTLPIEMDVVAKEIGLNEEYEECAIHDYEAPFKISEYASIEKLNQIAIAMDSCDEEECNALMQAVDEGIASDFLEALEKYQNGSLSWVTYHDCKDMSDVAYHLLEETGQLKEMPDMLSRYFDYEAYGRDLEIEGTFIQLNYDTYIEFLY